MIFGILPFGFDSILLDRNVFEAGLEAAQGDLVGGIEVRRLRI